MPRLRRHKRTEAESPPASPGWRSVCHVHPTVGNAIRNAINALQSQWAGPGLGWTDQAYPGLHGALATSVRHATHVVTRCAYIVHVGQCPWAGCRAPRAGWYSRAAWICKCEGGGRLIASGPVQRTSIPLVAPMHFYLRHLDTGTRQTASNELPLCKMCCPGG